MRIALIIVILIAIGAGVWFVSTNETEAPTVDDLPAENETGTLPPSTEDEPEPEAPQAEPGDSPVPSGTDAGMEFPVADDEPLPEPEPAATVSDVTVVTYTDSGFSPETVTIATGDTVRFVNNSSRGMWVGSDNHPSHTLYPDKSGENCLGSAFDQCEASSSGTTWEFTFNETGSHGYHNHVRARDGGTVIVR